MTGAIQVESLWNGLYDSNGFPLSGGKVWTYAAGTTTLKTTWQDQLKGAVHANPIILDSTGRRLVYADGMYKFDVFTAADVPLFTFDYLTFSRPGDGVVYLGGAATGSGNAQAVTLNPPITAYTDGMKIRFRAVGTNTVISPTLNVNGVGAKTIVRRFYSNVLEVGDLLGGGWYEVIYDQVIDSFLLVDPTQPWNPYTPTITASAGTLSGVTSSGFYCRQENGLINFNAIFGATLAGASAQFYCTVPITAADAAGVFAGIAGSNSANFLLADTTRALCAVVLAPGVYGCRLSGSYRGQGW